MDVRIATLNIFWYPSSTFIGNRRSDEDRAKIREVIRRLDADILVFQEILDLDDLERLLGDLIPGRAYSLKDEAGRWAASGAGHEGMKVPLAFDSRRLELLEAGSALKAGQPAATGGKRDPVAARLRPVGGGESLTVIGVHLKSGVLTVPPQHAPADDVRVLEMQNLTDWITSLSPIRPGGAPREAGEPTVLLGDFNAVRRNVSLKPLSAGGELASWSWPEPLFASNMSPSPVPSDLPEAERWTTHLDREIIDHVILSPEVQLVEGPWVYAFDRDDSWLAAAGVTRDWLEQRAYTFTPENKPPEKRENLHRVTDHRPVRVTVSLT